MTAFGWAVIGVLALALYAALPLTSGPRDRGGLWARPFRGKRGR